MNEQTGRYNLISDVAGIKIGHAQSVDMATGVSVILPDERAVAACDIRGGAPGTRETDALAPENFVDAVDGIFLSGGSVYGLTAGSGIVDWLGARGRGFRLMNDSSVPSAPVVPGAILFDLANGGDKNWGARSPYYDLAQQACESADEKPFALGNIGAGYGAAAGNVKGGLGSASLLTPDGFEIGALAAINSFGSVVRPGTKKLWAADYEISGEMGGVEDDRKLDMTDIFANSKMSAKPAVRPSVKTNTSLAVIAVNAALSPSEALRIAIMAQDGLARAIRPAHTIFDGDSVFVLATGRKALSMKTNTNASMNALEISTLGGLAADCLARACGRAIWEAESLNGLPSYREAYGL